MGLSQVEKTVNEVETLTGKKFWQQWPEKDMLTVF